MSSQRYKTLVKNPVIAVSFLLLLSVGAPSVAQNSAVEKNSGKSKAALVWPLPPEKPRFGFVAQIRGAADVEPVPKQSIMQRLAGVQKKQFSPNLEKPFGIATDSKHRIYVSDTGQSVIFIFDREQRKVSYLGLDGNPKFRVPMGIVVDAKDRIWVADAGARRIYAFDSNHVLRAALGKPGELVNPVALAIDNTRNRLYVADSKQQAIVVYNTETGLLIRKFGKRGLGTGEFNFPTDVAVDKDGRIYVADSLNRRVQLFDSNYKFADKIGSEGLEWGHFRKPKSVATDEYGNIYVLDADFCNFQVFDSKKRLLMFLGGFGEDPGQFSVPQQIRIDGDVIYIVDQMNARIQILRLIDGTVDEPAAAESK